MVGRGRLVLLRMGEMEQLQVRQQQISTSLGAGQSIVERRDPTGAPPPHRSPSRQSPAMDAVNSICCVKEGECFQPRGPLTAAARHIEWQILPVFSDKILSRLISASAMADGEKQESPSSFVSCMFTLIRGRFCSLISISTFCRLLAGAGSKTVGFHMKTLDLL